MQFKPKLEAESRGPFPRLPKIECETYYVSFLKKKTGKNQPGFPRFSYEPLIQQSKQQDKAKSHGLGCKRPAFHSGPTTNQLCHFGKVLMALGISSKTRGNRTSLEFLFFVSFSSGTSFTKENTSK